MSFFERRCAGAAALALIGAAAPPAFGQPLDVYVRFDDAERDAAARLSAELRSEGHQLRFVSHPVGPCSRGGGDADGGGALAGEPAPPAYPLPLASIEIALDRERGELVARVCYAAPSGGVDVTSLRAPADDPRRLALAAVEALNGLQARAPALAAPASAPAPVPPPAPPSGERRSASLFASAVLVLQPTEGGPLVGSDVGVDVDLGPHLGLELSVFVPLRETEFRGVRRELSVEAAWARLGPRVAWALPPLRFGASAQVGPALIWASAKTEDPSLLGTTELARAALVAGGLWLESPDDEVFYFRATAMASRLFPSIDVELGDGSVQRFGQILLETGIGAGLRW